MARKGNILWQVERSRTIEGSEFSATYVATTMYAMRADGVLLESLKTKREGEKAYHYNWTIRTRKPKADVRDILTRQGFK